MRKQLENYLLSIIKGESNNLLDKTVRFILSLLEIVYQTIINIRKVLYKLGLLKSKDLEVDVISVGNITTGGTGKTPVVERLALELLDKGKKVGVLSRGYQSKGDSPLIISDGENILVDVDEAGDELYMMASHLSGIPIIKGKNRYKAGKLALSKFDLDVLIVDDSFQHWQLKRDLDIVVVDALNPFGYDHLLPRGILREQLSSFKRADIVIISRSVQVSQSKLEQIKKKIYNYNSKVDIFKSIHNPVNIDALAVSSQEYLDSPEELSNRKALALSGIGNPESFVKSLEELGAKVVETANYPDHYEYKSEDVMDIAMEAQLNEAEFVITTDKDAVKFDKNIIKKFNKMDLDIYSLGINLILEDNINLSAEVLEFLRNKNKWGEKY